MNRRLPIFIVVFLIVAAAGFGYTYSIAPIYVATATIQVEPGTPADAQSRSAFVANEAHALTSNEMLESVLSRLRANRAALTNASSVPQLRDMLAAVVSPGSNVVELRAQGGDRLELAALTDAWAQTYLASRSIRRTDDRRADIDEARAAVEGAETRVARKRRELDDFRRRHDILSPERDENAVAAQTRSMNTALNDARRKATDAESRLAALKASVAEGKPVYRDRDKQALTQLEQRADDTRQRIVELSRKFTPDYLAFDPQTKNLPATLKQLEQAIEQARRRSQQEMLSEAEQDVVAAQKNVATLEKQSAALRKEALTFTSSFAEHKAQATELAQLEEDLGRKKARLTTLETADRGSEPKYVLLGQPAVSERPVHPDYRLYAVYTAGGALAAALLAVLLVEFLNPKPKPEMDRYPQPIIQIAYPPLPGQPASRPLQLEATAARLPHSMASLPVPEAPRELTIAEVNAIWEAATDDARLAIAAVFSGLTLQELAILRWSDVDLAASCIRCSPDTGREPVSITPVFARELTARKPREAAHELVAITRDGRVLTPVDLAGLVAAAAHDAGLDEADAIDADTLRHTYVSFLVREGARLSELERIVGPVPPALFLHYRYLSPPGRGVPVAAVNRAFPAFRSA
jgi:polysaccharide biosynthesis transport protein